VLAALAALAMSWATPSLEAASSLEPGVHVDPGSPAAKEYALPLNQARQTGGGSSSQSSSEGALFGAGIKPPSSGSPRGGGGRSDAHTPAGGAVIGPGSQTALAEDVLRAARAHESASGDGSILALIGGGVAILVLGGFGGTVLRHVRRPTSSSMSDAV
jgi:hypothetical protein